MLALVRRPKTPSTSARYCPLSCRVCCIFFTSSPYQTAGTSLLGLRPETSGLGRGPETPVPSNRKTIPADAAFVPRDIPSPDHSSVGKLSPAFNDCVVLVYDDLFRLTEVGNLYVFQLDIEAFGDGLATSVEGNGLQETL